MEDLQMEVKVNQSVPKPGRMTLFPFKTIPVKGALIVTPSEGEDQHKLLMRTRNAAASFKKAHKGYALSIHFLKEKGEIWVYRDENSVG